MSHAARPTRRARLARRGMTLLEVMVALTILSGALLALGRYSGEFTRTNTASRNRLTALQLATARLDSVKGAPTYVGIDAFAGTEATVTGYPTFRRVTTVRRVGGNPEDLVDYKVISVSVTGTALRTPVKKTTMVTAF